MEDTKEEVPLKKIPFNNLYLANGFVSGNNKFWMYLFTFSVVVFFFGSYQYLIFVPLTEILHQNGYSAKEIMADTSLLFNSEALGLDRNLILFLELGMFVVTFAAFYFALRFVHWKPFLSVLSGYEKFRFRRFFFSLLVWGSLVSAGTLIEYFTNPGNLVLNSNYKGLLISLLIAICLMPIQSGLEEILFRGYLLQGLSQIFRGGLLPLIITSLLFGAAHLGNPEVEKYGTLTMMTYYVCFAAFMGFLTLLDEGLELALGLHIANNIFGVILVNDKHAAVKSYSVFDSNSVSADLEVLVWFIMAAITFGIFWLKYRWKNFAIIIK